MTSIFDSDVLHKVALLKVYGSLSLGITGAVGLTWEYPYLLNRGSQKFWEVVGCKSKNFPKRREVHKHCWVWSNKTKLKPTHFLKQETDAPTNLMELPSTGRKACVQHMYASVQFLCQKEDLGMRSTKGSSEKLGSFLSLLSFMYQFTCTCKWRWSCYNIKWWWQAKKKKVEMIQCKEVVTR